MATKLKNLCLTSVDLVRAGANQEADICLFKSLDGAQDENPHTKTTRTISKSDPNRFDKIQEVKKFNPYHGKDGRFSSAANGGGIVPTRMQGEVRNAIKNLQRCDMYGVHMDYKGERDAELCVNPIPYSGKRASDAIDEHMRGIDEFWIENWESPWNDGQSTIKSVKIDSLKSIQQAVSPKHLEDIMDSGKSDFKDDIFVVRMNRQNYLVNGNHRTALAKLAGKKSIKARVYDIP